MNSRLVRVIHKKDIIIRHESATGSRFSWMKSFGDLFGELAHLSAGMTMVVTPHASPHHPTTPPSLDL